MQINKGSYNIWSEDHISLLLVATHNNMRLFNCLVRRISMGQLGVDSLFVSAGRTLFPGQIMTEVLFFLGSPGVTAPLLYM